jgi:2-dehydro-3-deoxyphosphogluconate aldolase/(4S)-4-hydroxy-2-oxoglutarate aldolase
MSLQLLEELTKVRVVPVVTIERANDAVPLAQALVRGGLPVVEITLRTQAALEAIERIVNEVPECTVGAGTIVSSRQVDDVLRVGAKFGVSPGLEESVVERARVRDLFLIPGIATPSEVMGAQRAGFNLLKVFPAESLGGADYVRALSAVFPSTRWFATGGIRPANVASYLSVPQLVCIGGSWMVPPRALSEQRWEEISGYAKTATSEPSRSPSAGVS